MIRAELIGEESAGMTAVEIYDGDTLVWANRWFTDGASEYGYISGLTDALRCMLASQAYECYHGGLYLDNGHHEPQNRYPTSGTMLVNEEGNWRITDDARRYGQSSEIIDAAIMLGLVLPDDDYDSDNDIARAIVARFKSKI